MARRSFCLGLGTGLLLAVAAASVLSSLAAWLGTADGRKSALEKFMPLSSLGGAAQKLASAVHGSSAQPATGVPHSHPSASASCTLLRCNTDRLTSAIDFMFEHVIMHTESACIHAWSMRLRFTFRSKALLRSGTAAEAPSSDMFLLWTALHRMNVTAQARVSVAFDLPRFTAVHQADRACSCFSRTSLATAAQQTCARRHTRPLPHRRSAEAHSGTDCSAGRPHASVHV